MNKLCVSILFLLLAFQASAKVQIHEGELDGAPYRVATPDAWDGGSVFFMVNGWRPSDAPHVADLDITDPFVAKVLESDWAVARTAFKKNGVDHNAHTEALYALKEWIGTELGEIDLVVLEGESTAGTLLLRIAERNPDLASGVIALAAFIEVEDSSSDDYLTAEPKIPAILMSNLTEIEGPVAYVALAQNAPVTPSLRPLRRPGHVNLNWVERWDAFRDLEAWLTGGTVSTFVDGTRKVPGRETRTREEQGALINSVTSVNPFYGNATLGFHPDELRAGGIEQGTTVELEAHGKTWSIFYGESYGDVGLGEWIAFPAADDQVLLARNHQSATETAGLAVGDTISIRLPQE